MIINVHAGHNPDGKAACGAVGLIKESTEARNVKNEVIVMLKKLGHTVYDCTVDDGINQSDVLKKIVAKCNAKTVDLDVSIHFNAGVSDAKGDGKTTGVEVLLYSQSSQAREKAVKVCNAIAAAGYRNRGVKYNSSLYFLKNTKAPAMLIECCFVDDKDDVERYQCYTMAKAITEAITSQNINITGEKPQAETLPTNAETPAIAEKASFYRVQCGAYMKKENAAALQKKLKEAGFESFITSA